MSESQYQPIEAKSFFAGLFDMKFKTYVTPKLARLLYILLIVVIAMQLIYIIIWFNINADIGSGILIGIVYSFIALVFSRVAVESVIAFFSAVADLRRLATDITDDVTESDQ